MGKFGKKVEVSTNLNEYLIGVLAPSGFGKTTLMYQVCEKEFGPDGYIILDMCQENGVAALQGAVAEKVSTWKKMKEIVDDIVKNKETDYPNLRVVVIDTLDAAFEACEQYTIDTYNRENLGKKDFVKASSINGVEGGFGRGLDKCIENVKKEISRLNSVGVGVFYAAHVKEKDQIDLFSGASYSVLTANMSMKYFNSIRNSSHIIAFGYFDREIERQEVDAENPITKKKRERKAVIDETRKLKFRDSALVADAKSRFSKIVDEIPLDPDLFIKAIKDAIEAERNSGPVATPPTSKKSTKTVVETPIVVEEPVEEVVDDTLTVFNESTVDPETLCTEIRKAFKSASIEDKQAVKAILTEKGKGKLDVALGEAVLSQIASILGV